MTGDVIIQRDEFKQYGPWELCTVNLAFFSTPLFGPDINTTPMATLFRQLSPPPPPNPPTPSDLTPVNPTSRPIDRHLPRFSRHTGQTFSKTLLNMRRPLRPRTTPDDQTRRTLSQTKKNPPLLACHRCCYAHSRHETRPETPAPIPWNNAKTRHPGVSFRLHSRFHIP